MTRQCMATLTRLSKFSRPTLGRRILPTQQRGFIGIARIKPMLKSTLRALWLLPLILSLFSATDARAQGQVAGPPNAILCNQGAQINNATSTSVFSLASGVTNQRIYLCGWHVTTQSSGATFQIFTGTSSGSSINCLAGVAGTGFPGTAVSPSTLTPSLAVSSTAPATDHIDFAMVQGQVGAALCIGITTLSSASAMVYFSQF